MNCKNSIETKYIKCIIGRKELNVHPNKPKNENNLKLLNNYILISVLNPSNRYENIINDIIEITNFLNSNILEKEFIFYKGNGTFERKIINKEDKKSIRELKFYLLKLNFKIEKIKKEFNNQVIDINTIPIELELLNNFNSFLTVKFWDIEEDIANYKVISIQTSKKIKDFILNKEKYVKKNNLRFIIHCSAGISRSAAIGMAIHYLYDHYYTSIDNFLRNCLIKKHTRYSPNITVFKKIIEKF